MAAQRAYEIAGVKNPREEISMAEVHDCFYITELVIVSSKKLLFQIVPDISAMFLYEDHSCEWFKYLAGSTSCGINRVPYYSCPHCGDSGVCMVCVMEMI